MLKISLWTWHYTHNPKSGCSDCLEFQVGKFERLLESSPTLVAAMQRFLQSEEIANYLQQRHHMEPARVKEWVERATRDIQTKSIPTDAIAVERKQQEFGQVLLACGGCQFFKTYRQRR